jgi:hypothetical protein
VIKVSPSPPILGEIESKLVYEANYKSPTSANPILARLILGVNKPTPLAVAGKFGIVKVIWVSVLLVAFIL